MKKILVLLLFTLMLTGCGHPVVKQEPIKHEPVKQEVTKVETKEAKLPIEETINKITITLNKVVQDSDSLKLYVTYANNSDDEVITNDSLAKIVFNGKQYEYSHDFNFDRYYKKDIKAPDIIEKTVKADTVIFFEPIPNVDKINVVLNAQFEDYKFDNVKVESQ